MQKKCKRVADYGNNLLAIKYSYCRGQNIVLSQATVDPGFKEHYFYWSPLYIEQIPRSLLAIKTFTQPTVQRALFKKFPIILSKIIGFFNALYYGCNKKYHIDISIQKQLPKCVLRKKCSENMHQIYRRKPMLNCDFNKVDRNFIETSLSSWLFSCKCTAYLQNTFP